MTSALLALCLSLPPFLVEEMEGALDSGRRNFERSERQRRGRSAFMGMVF